jgi:predicted DNA-binding mobile mystery protein A
MRKQGWEGRLAAVDEAANAFRVAKGVGAGLQASGGGWLRAMRLALGATSKETAGRMGVVVSDLYRIENAEARGAVELQTLRRAAEALGCDLVYGLAPKTGTVAAMAAEIEGGRAERRRAAYVRSLEKAKEKRMDAAEQKWFQQQRNEHAEEWRRFQEAWNIEMPSINRPLPPKILRLKPWGREALRKALKARLRKEGIRLR